MKILCTNCNWLNHIFENSISDRNDIYEVEEFYTEYGGKKLRAYKCPICGQLEDANYTDLFYSINTIESVRNLISLGRGIADIACEIY